ncbi:MAG TPA: hypothetical protein VEX36_06855 [Thermoleophilaceae bacterium]|nr:hypothetical protein [Thermoleophilaceae bacterium]
MQLAPKALAVALTAGIALGAVACGDDETDSTEPAVTAQPTETAATETAPRPAETEISETESGETDTAEADGGGAAAPDGQSSPENQPGGAGDEVPASSQALITGRDGGLHPTVVRVPPFIAIRVELNSADGVEYELAGGGRDVKAGGEIKSASTTYDGLRPGKRLILTGPQGKVTIEATAEPGP